MAYIFCWAPRVWEVRGFDEHKNPNIELRISKQISNGQEFQTKEEDENRLGHWRILICGLFRVSDIEFNQPFICTEGDFPGPAAKLKGKINIE
jgi:hypothetical protein